ncbi:uncharacterized protein LOC114354307 [Ostrinia furnacalis]|uniref:uncharacterized protein LOC114354307 n=1 Tax=Ostrinia furnacalis TaxID=93504 RepID=UPI00103A65DF|nr:uncharacterized protein LOC114354307 [Ostrinia furnacalis]
MFVDGRARRCALNENLVEQLIGNGCTSDLEEESDEEQLGEAFLFLENDADSPHNGEGNESDEEMGVPLAQLRQLNVTEPRNQPAASTSGLPKQERRRIWRATNFEIKCHDFPPRVTAGEVKKLRLRTCCGSDWTLLML